MCHRLQELHIPTNFLLGKHVSEESDTSAMINLARAIGTSKLEVVDLSGTQLCGVWDDADTSKRGDLLVSRSFQGRYTIEPVLALAESIAACSTLTDLQMRNNKVEYSEEAVRALEEASRDEASGRVCRVAIK